MDEESSRAFVDTSAGSLLAFRTRRPYSIPSDKSNRVGLSGTGTTIRDFAGSAGHQRLQGFSFQPPGAATSGPGSSSASSSSCSPCGSIRRNPAPMSPPQGGSSWRCGPRPSSSWSPHLPAGHHARCGRPRAGGSWRCWSIRPRASRLPAGGMRRAHRADQVGTVLGDIRDGLSDRHGLRAWGFRPQVRPCRRLKLTPPPGADRSRDIPPWARPSRRHRRNRPRRAGAVVVACRTAWPNQGIDPVAVGTRSPAGLHGRRGSDSSASMPRWPAPGEPHRLPGDDVRCRSPCTTKGWGHVGRADSRGRDAPPGREEVVAKQAIVGRREGAEQQIRLKFRPPRRQHFYEVRLPGTRRRFTAVNNRRMLRSTCARRRTASRHRRHGRLGLDLLQPGLAPIRACRSPR
jgi:hypothetical protein